MIYSFADKVQLQRRILKKYVLICFHPNMQGKRFGEFVLLYAFWYSLKQQKDEEMSTLLQKLKDELREKCVLLLSILATYHICVAF